MAYPAGVTTQTVNVGRVVDFFGADATVSVQVTPVIGGTTAHIVHQASGIPMVPVTRTFDGAAGAAATFTVPHSDLPGWVGPNGTAVLSWAYRVEVTARPAGGGAASTWTKTIALPSAQAGPIDFDLIPEGGTVEPVYGDAMAVLSIDGKVGHLTAADLPTPPTAPHSHAMGEVTGLDAALAGKAAASHVHGLTDVTGLTSALAGKADAGHVHGWADITDKPATFPAAAHTHTTAEVTGLDTALAGKAASTHTHAGADITSGTIPASAVPLATASAQGGINATNFSRINNAVSTATASRVVIRDAAGRAAFADPAANGDAATMGWTNTQLLGKAAATHVHGLTDVTGLDTALAGKADTARGLPAGGTTGQVLAKTSATDYAASWQTIATGGGVTDHGALTGLGDDDHTQYALADGSRGSFASTTHTHTTAQVTGLDTALAGKAATTHQHAAGDVTSGTLDPARLPAATTSAAGSMSAADKTKLDNATAAATASRLAMRDAAGRLAVATPAAAGDAATMGYVDGRTWVGNQAAYDALGTKDSTVNYLVTA